MNQEDHAKTPEAFVGPSVPKASLASAERWRAIIQEQRASGLSVSAFCRQRGLTASSLFAWRRRLDDSGQAQDAGKTSAKAKASTFAEVKVIAEPKGSRDCPTDGLELRLRGHRSLIVRSGFDRQLLIDLLGVLEGSASTLEALP